LDGLSESPLYEAEVTGAFDLPADQSTCGMPVSVQIERLEREIDTRLGGGFLVIDTDLYSLEGVERDLALDAVVAGEPSPFVLLEGQLVCTGAVEVSAVLNALLRSSADDTSIVLDRA